MSEVGDAAVRVAALGYYRVVHKAGVRIRQHASELPDSTATVLPQGTIIRGRRVGDFVQLGRSEDGHESQAIGDTFGDTVDSSASGEVDEDGVVVGPRGAWVPFVAKGLPGLERAGGALDAVTGAFWYRVVSPRGMQFITEPRLDAPRHAATHARGSVLKAVRKRSTPGSPFVFAELDKGLGFVVEARPSAAAITAATRKTGGGEKLPGGTLKSKGGTHAGAVTTTIAHGAVGETKTGWEGKSGALSSMGTSAGANYRGGKSGGSGWDAACAAALHLSGELLERFDGEPCVAPVSPEERDQGQVYFRVCHPGGLRVREGPDLAAKDVVSSNVADGGGSGYGGGRGKAAVLGFRTVFVGSEVLTPAGCPDATFVKLQDNSHQGWVCAVRGKLLAAEVLSPPLVEDCGCWWQVLSKQPLPVLRGPSPNARPTGKHVGFGLVFASQRRVTPLGCADRFVELNTAEGRGWVAERRLSEPTSEELAELRAEAEEKHAAGLAAVAEAAQGDDAKSLAQETSSSLFKRRTENGGGGTGGGGSSSSSSLVANEHFEFLLGGGGSGSGGGGGVPTMGLKALEEVLEPVWAPGPWLCQVLYPGGMRVRLNPHERAHSVPGPHSVVPAYAVVKVDGSLTLEDKNQPPCFPPLLPTTTGSSSSSSSSSSSLHAAPNDCALAEASLPPPPPPLRTAASTALSRGPLYLEVSTAETRQPVRLLSSDGMFTLGRSGSNSSEWRSSSSEGELEYDDEDNDEDDDDDDRMVGGGYVGSRRRPRDEQVKEGRGGNELSLPLPLLPLESDAGREEAAPFGVDGDESPHESLFSAPPLPPPPLRASTSRVFFKLSGRPGWLVAEHNRKPVTCLVAGTPSEDRGRFVYRVSAAAGACERGGVRVRHGPFLGSPPLECVLLPGALVAGRVRLTAFKAGSAGAATPEATETRDGENGEGFGDREGGCRDGGGCGGNGGGCERGGSVFVGGDFSEEEVEVSGGSGVVVVPKTVTGWLPTADADGTCLLEFVSEKVESSTPGRPLSAFEPTKPEEPRPPPPHMPRRSSLVESSVPLPPPSRGGSSSSSGGSGSQQLEETEDGRDDDDDDDDDDRRQPNGGGHVGVGGSSKEGTGDSQKRNGGESSCSTSIHEERKDAGGAAVEKGGQIGSPPAASYATAELENDWTPVQRHADETRAFSATTKEVRQVGTEGRPPNADSSAPPLQTLPKLATRTTFPQNGAHEEEKDDIGPGCVVT